MNILEYRELRKPLINKIWLCITSLVIVLFAFAVHILILCEFNVSITTMGTHLTFMPIYVIAELIILAMTIYVGIKYAVRCPKCLRVLFPFHDGIVIASKCCPKCGKIIIIDMS
jgi:hypothetical protein